MGEREECIKEGAADRIERASASSPLIGSDVKRRILQKMYFFCTESVFIQHGKYISSTRKIYFFNTENIFLQHRLLLLGTLSN